LNINKTFEAWLSIDFIEKRYAIIERDLTEAAAHGKGARMTDKKAKADASVNDAAPALPDHLSLDPRSEHFNQDVLERGVGIRFNGIEKTNVEEYSVSEGWIRVAAGRSRDRFGNPMTVKLKGVVEPYYEERAGERDGEASE
jgi:hypothetical protein